MTMKERRTDARISMDRPLKVQCAETGRYLAGRTRNVSASGAMIEIDHPSLLVAGQRLRVGIAWTKQNALLDGKQMLEATVVRSLGLGSAQHVALAFARRQELAKVG